MTYFDYKIVEEAAKQLYINALTNLPPDVRKAINNAYKKETDEGAKKIFEVMLKNIELADSKKMLICQDTGLPIFMVKIGNAFAWDGAEIKERLKEGAKRATVEFPFRGSSTHPITRMNPQTSVGERMPIIYFDFVPGSEKLDILMIPKGSGSENMSTMKMLIPADGVDGIKRFVIDSFIAAGANPCPPGIIGVGVGGTADSVVRLAKEAIARPVGERNPDPIYAHLEEELEQAINSTGIGPQGLGGDVSTLAVHVEGAYTHITQNPVAVNTQCWPARRARVFIKPDGSCEYGF